jgi:hypothetical protein
MSAANRPRSRFREAEMLDLTLDDQILHRARNILDRYRRIHAVLVEKVDGVDLEALQRGLRNLLDVLRSTVEARLFSAGKLEAELGGDDDL